MYIQYNLLSHTLDFETKISQHNCSLNCLSNVKLQAPKCQEYVFQPSIQKQNPGSAPQPLETMGLLAPHMGPLDPQSSSFQKTLHLAS